MVESIISFLDTNITAVYGPVLTSIILLAGIAAASVAAYYLTKALLSVVEKAVLRSPTQWDDDLINRRFINAVSQLAPAIVVAWALPRFFSQDITLLKWIYTLTRIYVLWAIVRIVVIFIGNLYEGMARREKLKMYAVQGIFQMLKLIVIGIGAIIGLSIIINKTPVAILTALGASAAVLMLVFKDTILGLVASVQLTANNMLKKGDWIIVPGHGANGEVIDVSLTTIKVQNWDKSVTTIPPYTLVSDSFSNFEPMRFSGGRRVCRAVYIDVNSVRFCSPADIATLRDGGWLEGIELSENERIVNLNLLRRYLEHYIRTRPEVNSEMLYMVRQLDPTPSGLPLQLYFFTRTTEWKDYEHIQSDIFDHIYAVINLFGLSIFQTPAGKDLTAIADLDRR